LTGVNEVIVRGGQLPVVAAPPEQGGPRPVSPRRKGVKQGGGIMMIGLFLIPAFAIVMELLDLNLELPFIGLLVFLAGLLRMLYAGFFEEGAPKRGALPAPATYTPPQHLEGGRYEALPPAPGTPVYGYRPQAHTAEMQPPPSVTDHTTRLLEQQAERERDER
jgi:hypothetical protein